MKTILIVDDNETNIDNLMALLEDKYDLLAAIDGESAIELLEEEKVDLILLDIMMPGIDGFETCKRIKDNPKLKNIPIIFITAKTDEDSIEKAYEVGGVDYITKPFRSREVLSRISNHLALSEQHHHLEHLVAQRTKELQNTQNEIIYLLGLVGECRSRETGNHVKRVGKYSEILALAYGFDEKEAKIIGELAQMHDLGKVAIPDAILNKPGRFSDEEFEHMKKHSDFGYIILNKSKRDLLKKAAIIAHQHHEKWNGKGYPRGLKGEQIHIYGRIVAIADVFDALGSERVYKPAWSDEEIIQLFKEERGESFDPKLVDLFFENIDKFYKVREELKDH